MRCRSKGPLSRLTEAPRPDIGAFASQTSGDPLGASSGRAQAARTGRDVPAAFRPTAHTHTHTQPHLSLAGSGSGRAWTFGQVADVDAASAQDRSWIDPKTIPDGNQIDPRSAAERLRIDFRAKLDRKVEFGRCPAKLGRTWV